eukprot:s5693_g7.t1
MRVELRGFACTVGRPVPRNCCENVDPGRLPYAAGLFAVLKDTKRDRLILDSRPANVLEEPPHFWTSSLAGASALLPIVLEPGQVLRISAAALRDFFYFFAVSQQRLQRNVIKARQALDLFGYSCEKFKGADGLVRVGLSTLAMGDSSACEFAQEPRRLLDFRVFAPAPLPQPA